MKKLFIASNNKNKIREIRDILDRNGVEVELRQLTPVEGPYYDWADFKAWCAKLYEEHPLVQQ